MVSTQARALPLEKLSTPRNARSVLDHVLGIGIAGEPARERIGIGEMRQHHVRETPVAFGTGDLVSMAIPALDRADSFSRPIAR